MLTKKNNTQKLLQLHKYPTHPNFKGKKYPTLIYTKTANIIMMIKMLQTQ